MSVGEDRGIKPAASLILIVRSRASYACTVGAGCMTGQSGRREAYTVRDSRFVDWGEWRQTPVIPGVVPMGVAATQSVKSFPRPRMGRSNLLYTARPG